MFFYFSSLHSGSRCLAKHTDDLWHDAFVRYSYNTELIMSVSPVHSMKEVLFDCVIGAVETF